MWLHYEDTENVDGCVQVTDGNCHFIGQSPLPSVHHYSEITAWVLKWKQHTTLYMKVWKCPVMCDSYVISPAFLFLTNLCHLQYFVAYLCGWLFALLLGIQATGLRLCKGTTKKGSLLVHSCASKFSVLFFLSFLLCLALRNVPCRFFCTAEFATWFCYLALPIDLGGHRLEINKFVGKIAK